MISDYQLEVSLVALSKELEIAKSNGQDNFSVHIIFFDGLDINRHLQEFARQHHVQIDRSTPDQITFLIR